MTVDRESCMMPTEFEHQYGKPACGRLTQDQIC